MGALDLAAALRQLIFAAVLSPPGPPEAAAPARLLTAQPELALRLINVTVANFLPRTKFLGGSVRGVVLTPLRAVALVFASELGAGGLLQLQFTPARAAAVGAPATVFRI